jgi:hypothetical protein
MNIYSEMSDSEFDYQIALNIGFKSMDDLISSKGTYCPSCDCSQPFMRALAYRFDCAMRALGDDRRAYLYGSEKQKELAEWGR